MTRIDILMLCRRSDGLLRVEGVVACAAVQRLVCACTEQCYAVSLTHFTLLLLKHSQVLLYGHVTGHATFPRRTAPQAIPLPHLSPAIETISPALINLIDSSSTHNKAISRGSHSSTSPSMISIIEFCRSFSCKRVLTEIQVPAPRAISC